MVFVYFHDQPAGDSIPGVARWITLHIVGLRVDDNDVPLPATTEFPPVLSVTRGFTTVAFVSPLAATVKLFMSPACSSCGFCGPCCLPAGLKCEPADSNVGGWQVAI